LNVRFLIPARRELTDAFRYYESKHPGLGESFRDAAWDAVQRVRRLPNAYPNLGGAIRRCHLRRFPYAIIFAVADTEIVIIAVAHLRRRPGYWRGRFE
jgi:plasmid stabilization system protein ParE